MTDVNWLVVPIGAPLALVLTFAMRTLARRRGWMDVPGLDRLHAVPVPRLGGAAMYAAFVVVVLVVVRPYDLALAGLIIGATLITAVMLVDDIRGMGPRKKLLAQLVTAAIPIGFGIRIDAVSNPIAGGVIDLPLAVVIPFTLFWIVGMMNAINFLDGQDGLAGGVSTIAALILVALSIRLGLPGVATIALALAAVSFGFLPLNFHRASIMMGDGGSHFLGFAIAVIAILGPAKIATAILVLGVPILEVAWSIIRRLARGGSIGARDAQHLHHRLWEAGLDQRVVALLYYVVAAAFGIIALVVERITKLYAFAGLTVFIVVLLVTLARLPRRRLIGRDAEPPHAAPQ